MNTNKKFFGVILAASVVFFWGITFVCTKHLLNEFSSLEILAIRFIAAYLGLWVLRPKWEHIPLKDNLWFALAGLTGVTLYQFAENVAINFTSASNVSVIVSICPLFTAIVAQIFLKEKHITPFFILGFVLAITGVALVNFNGRANLQLNPKGDLLALLAAVCWGFYSMCVSIINKKGFDSICSTRRVFFFAVILMIPLIITGTFAPDGSSIKVTWDAAVNAARFSKGINWFNLLFLGLIASGFCFSAWNKACNILGTVKTTAGIYLIPVVTIIVAFIVLDEKITLMGAIGAVITITGLFITGITPKKKQEKQDENQNL